MANLEEVRVRQNTSVLLIGSYKCEQRRAARWMVDGVVHTRPGLPGADGFKKSNIKKAYKKVGGKTEIMDETEWVEGDLEIMTKFLGEKIGVDTIYTFTITVKKTAAVTTHLVELTFFDRLSLSSSKTTRRILYCTTLVMGLLMGPGVSQRQRN